MAFDPSFTDYSRDPSGGIYFKRPGAPDFFHAGEDAEKLAAYIDASKPPDMRTADLASSGYGLPPDSSAARNLAVANTPAPNLPPDAMAALTAPDGPPPATAPSPGDVPPPNVPPANLAPGAAPGAPEPVGPQMPGIPESWMSNKVTVPGFDPAAADRRGVPVRQTQTKTTEGAKQYSPELEQGYADLHEAQVNAGIDRFLRDDAMAREQLKRAEGDPETGAPGAIAIALKKEAEAQRFEALVKDKVAEARGTLEDLSTEAAEAKIGGGSIWSNGAAAGIGTLIGAALASMGSARLGHGPSGFDVINQAIERDVRRQKDEVARKGAKATNALAMYERKFGDLELAQQALKIVQQQKAAAMYQQAAALDGSAKAKEAYDAFQLEAQKADLERRKQFEEDKRGKVILTESSKIMQPVAARERDITPEEYGKRAEAIVKGAKADRALRGDDPDLTASERLAKEKDERERSVRLQTGQRVYAPDTARRERFDALNRAAPVMRKGAAELEAILSTPGSSLSKAQQGRAKALAESMTNMGQKLFDKGALSEGDRKDFESLTAAGGMDTFESRTRIIAALRKGMETVDQLYENEARELYTDPAAKTPYLQTELEKRFKPGDTGETYEAPK